MEQPATYQDILHEGIHKGVQQGLKIAILSALDIRFGSVPAELDRRLEELTPDRLQELVCQAGICGTMEEFISQLDENG